MEVIVEVLRGQVWDAVLPVDVAAMRGNEMVECQCYRGGEDARGPERYQLAGAQGIQFQGRNVGQRSAKAVSSEEDLPARALFTVQSQ